MRGGSVLVLALLSACPGHKDVECTGNGDCNLGSGGVCLLAEPTGHQWCAYPDSGCPAGYRYSDVDVGDGLSGACVELVPRLTVMVGGNGSGRVTSTPGGIDCPGTCSAIFKKGEAVTLTQAASSSVFLGWSDACTGAVTCTVMLDSNKQVGALFGVPGSNVWLSQLFGSTAAEITRAKALSNRDMLVAGNFTGTIKLGASTLRAQGDGSAFVARLRAADGSVAWSRLFDSSQELDITGLDADSSNNALVAGKFKGTAIFNGPSTTSVGGFDAFVAKLAAADGAYSWVRTFGDSTNDSPVGIAVDSSGNAVVAGVFSGTISPGPQPLDGFGQLSMFIVKYAAANGAHLWSKGISGNNTYSALPQGVAVDGSGNVTVAGFFGGTTDFGGGAVTSTNPSFSQFVAKYAAANGGYLFDKEYSLSGSSYTSIRSLAIDTASNIYVSGEFSDTLTLTGTPPLVSAGKGDVYVVKYSQAGAVQWSRRFGNDQEDYSDALAIDAAGQLLFLGRFSGTIAYTNTNLNSAGGTDIVVARLNASDGAPAAAMRMGGTGDEFPKSVTAAGGNVFVGGYFVGFAEFGGQAISAAGTQGDGFALLVMPLN